MSFDLVGVIVTVGAYFAGSFPTATIAGMLSGHDPSREGSGNPGATNVYRISGAGYAMVTALVDMCKGFVPVLLALLLVDRSWGALAWIAVTAGHVFPIGRIRHGGKGVATGGGGALPLFPFLGVGLVALFAVVVKFTRTVSIGSLTIAVLLPLGVALLYEEVVELFAAVAVSVLVIWRHRSNIARLARGRELPFS